MLRPFSKITIQQVPTELWTDRNFLLNIDFVHEYEVDAGWETHTDSCKIVLPKNIELQTDKFLFQQSGTYNVILGGSGAIADGKNTDILFRPITYPPLIMKGDIVTITRGYRFKNEHGVDQIETCPIPIFSGYVSAVHSTIPIEINCEDNFYLLKRTPVGANIWNKDLVGLCKYMLDKCNSLFSGNPKLNINGVNPYPVLTFSTITDSLTANFALGHLDIGDVTCSQLLDRIRSQYHLESFFNGNILQFGFPIYNESRANSKNFFEFQNNILPDHDLEYKNKDDVILSAIVSCRVIRNTGKTTYDGSSATKREKIKILIYWDIPTETFKYIVHQKDEPFPSNTGGERHEFVYAIDPNKGAPPTQDLVNYGIMQLKKYYYTGFRGSFKTFAFPFVYWNDNVNIIDPVMADRNGQYKVKRVKYTGGVRGEKQEIYLDYKLDVQLPDINNALSISMI